MGMAEDARKLSAANQQIDVAWQAKRQSNEDELRQLIDRLTREFVAAAGSVGFKAQKHPARRGIFDAAGWQVHLSYGQSVGDIWNGQGFYIWIRKNGTWRVMTQSGVSDGTLPVVALPADIEGQLRDCFTRALADKRPPSRAGRPGPR